MPEQEPNFPERLINLRDGLAERATEVLDNLEHNAQKVAVVGGLVVALAGANVFGRNYNVSEAAIPSTSAGELANLPIDSNIIPYGSEIARSSYVETPTYCRENAGIIGPDDYPKPKFNYKGDSSRDWNTSFSFGNIQICKGRGTRRVSYYQEQSTDGGEHWIKSSNTLHSNGNTPICGRVSSSQLKCLSQKKSTLIAPFDCDNKDRTLVRATFRVRWAAKQGKDNIALYSYPSRKPTC